MLHIDFKKIKFLIPFLGSILIMLGLVKQIIYYNHFNIRITSFLELSEILTLFSSDLLLFSTSYLVVALLNFLMIPVKESVEHAETFDKFLEEPSFKKRLLLLKPIWFVFVVFNLGFIFLLIMSIFKHRDIYVIVSTLVMINLLVIILTTLREYGRTYYIKMGVKLDISLFNLMVMIIILTVQIINSAFMEVHFVKTLKKNINTSFRIADTQFKSDSTVYFIGQTKKYLFTYDEKNDQSTVYPISEIKHFIYGK